MQTIENCLVFGSRVQVQDEKLKTCAFFATRDDFQFDSVSRATFDAKDMAFDLPLEADRVGALNLFSTFVRAPVIGTIMWMFGGSKAIEEEQQELEQRQMNVGMTEQSSCSPSRQHLNGSSLLKPNGMRRCSSNLNKRVPSKSALKKSAPSLVGSEISDVGECSEALEGMHLVDSHGMLHSFKRRKKELSWSDESGQSLVEYVGEVRNTKRTLSITPWSTVHGVYPSSVR